MGPVRVRTVFALLAVAALVGASADARSAPQPPPQSPASSLPPTSSPTIDARLQAVQNELFTRPGAAADAVRTLTAILAEDPQSATGHMLLGLAYTMVGVPELVPESVAELRQALDLEPRLVVARFYLARVYLDISQPERAREELTLALEQVPNRPEFLAALSDAERRLGHADRAVDLARQTLAIDPTFADARYALGLALIDAHQVDEAIRELQPLGVGGTRHAGALYALGGAYLERGRISDALTSLLAAMDMTAPTPDARLNLARAYRLLGRLPEAAQALDQVFPPGASVQVSSFYQRIETDLAIERGLVQLAQDNPAAAADSFQQALAMDPNRGAAHRYLAQTYLALGRWTDANASAARARELGTPVASADVAAIAAGLAGQKDRTP